MLKDKIINLFKAADQSNDYKKNLYHAVQQLEKRCDNAGIQLIEQPPPFLHMGKQELVVELPAGRQKKRIRITSLKRVNSLLSIPFEKYVFLTPYSAICSYSDGTIEARINSIKEVEKIDLSSTSGVSIEVSESSKDLYCFFPRLKDLQASLKLKNLKVSRHGEAVDILRRISDALFFQIDIALGLKLSLSRKYIHGNWSLVREIKKERYGSASFKEITFPAQEYDYVPITLYFSARDTTMPLIQFLFYYQVLEFFFPSFCQAGAQRKIRRILKDPTFYVEKDTDIGRIISTIETSRSIFGDERSMMKSTLHECIDPQELRAFLKENDKKVKFFSSKAKGLTSVTLPIDNPKADIVNHTADRIYDIRCKIVHTKAYFREENDSLLPFSASSELIYYDIDLIEYLAQQVLISASSQLKL